MTEVKAVYCVMNAFMNSFGSTFQAFTWWWKEVGITPRLSKPFHTHAPDNWYGRINEKK